MGKVSNGSFDITYEEHGSGASTVLLVCGTGQQAAMWSGMGVVAALNAAGHRVVTFDNRGMAGAACPAPPWTVADMADDALAVLEAIGPAHVAGASLGALITQTMALRRPDLVRSAILMIGGGQFGPTWQPLMSGLTEILATGKPLPAGLQRFLMLQTMLTPPQRDDPELVRVAVAMSSVLTDTFGPGGQYGQYSASGTWVTEDHISELADISAPVLVIANEFDPCFPAVGLRAVAAAVKDGTYVEIPNASHVALDPASLELEVNAMVQFLAQRAPAA